MVRALFPRTPFEEVWTQFQKYAWEKQPEDIWQFSRQRYVWSKDQWPNISGHITTVWTLQDLGMLDQADPRLVEQVMTVRPLPERVEQQMDRFEHRMADDYADGYQTDDWDQPS